MYNAFIVRKKNNQEQQNIRQSERNHHYVQRYLSKTRPSLIDNYNKRINSFIRRMEEQPIKINLDPQKKTPRKSPEQELVYDGTSVKKQDPNSIRKRASSNISWGERGGSSLSVDQVEALGSHYFQFKFKDNEDFKSLFTPLERLERQKNYEIFKQKYGDPTLAFRSIGSQSEYKPYHDFRDRNKDLQIHPPMKYTQKPTKQILANIKNRKSLQPKNKGTHKGTNIRKSQNQSNLNSLQDEDIVIRRNTGSSISGFNEDGMGDNMSVGNLSMDEGQNPQNAKETNNEGKDKKQQKPVKLHFKQIMDLEQNITDPKTKKALRDLLYKCGVYRRKNRRAVTDSDVDQFSEFESMNK